MSPATDTLLDTLYERVKGSWEERFERRYGFWRGLADEAVRCRECPQEFLVAFSCKGRGLCPSCGAKRAAELGAFLMDEVVEEVGHAQWVFTIPKMLRVYFLYHRELLGELSRAALRRRWANLIRRVYEVLSARYSSMRRSTRGVEPRCASSDS
jgi:hypothetical protein